MEQLSWNLIYSLCPWRERDRVKHCSTLQSEGASEPESCFFFFFFLSCGCNQSIRLPFESSLTHTHSFSSSLSRAHTQPSVTESMLDQIKCHSHGPEETASARGRPIVAQFDTCEKRATPRWGMITCLLVEGNVPSCSCVYINRSSPRVTSWMKKGLILIACCLLFFSHPCRTNTVSPPFDRWVN